MLPIKSLLKKELFILVPVVLVGLGFYLSIRGKQQKEKAEKIRQEQRCEFAFQLGAAWGALEMLNLRIPTPTNGMTSGDLFQLNALNYYRTNLKGKL